MNENEFAELAAGHALHALTASDELRYAEALHAHPEWSAIAVADVETAALLADGTTPVTPPPALRAALLARVAETPQHAETLHDAETPASSAPMAAIDEPAAGAQVPAASTRRRPLRILFALAACLVLLIGLGVGAAVLTAQLSRPASVLALEQIENAEDAQQATVELSSGTEATAHWSESVGAAVLVAEGLEPLSEDQAYELWFVRGESPISAGVFEAQDGTTTAVLEGEMHEGDIIAVTVEQAGGSPTGKPTSDPILAIPTA